MPLGFVPKYCQVEEIADKHVFLVRLNRPKNLNSLHANCHWELDAVWNYFEANDDMWVGILTGNGRAFSAGNDLKATSGIDSDGDGKTFEGLKERGAQGQFGPASGFGGITNRQSVKPIIAAVNGVAHGGGFELALSCDILIVSEAADFALPEVRVGLYAAAGGVVKLPKLIGYQNAMAMILTGKRIKGAQAVQMGIAQQLVKDGEDLVQAALTMADEINLGNPDAVQVSVEVAKQSYTKSTPVLDAVANQHKTATHKRWQKGPNMKEGPLAFSQKRKPNWASPAPLAKL